MGDTIEIVEQVATVLEVAGPAGPQGPQGATGSGLGTLTTQGDTLYQGASAAQRLPIGSAGQILKVAASGIPEWGAAPASGVSSVNGESGAVSLSAADVGAAEILHAAEHQDGEADQIMASAAIVSTDDLTLNGIYVIDGTLHNSQYVYYRPGTRKNTKLQYNSGGYWELVKNLTVVGNGTGGTSTHPWSHAEWEDPRTPPSVSFLSAVVQASLEKLARSTTENLGTAALADSTSFAAANDARLSDARTPLAHAATHAASGSDPVFDQDLNTTDSPTFAGITATTWQSTSEQTQVSFADNFLEVFNEEVLSARFKGGNGVEFPHGITLQDSTDSTKQATFDVSGVTTETIRNLEIPDGDGVIALVDDIPTTASDIGAAASGSITASGLTQSTARILGRTSASTGSIEEIQIGSGLSLSAGQLSATASGGISAVGASTADVLSVSGSDLVADDPNADRIVFWDDSESKLRYLEAGSGLSISGTTMTVTATGGATNLWIPASAWIPRTTSGCGVDSREIGATNRQNVDELLFDTGSEEFAQALVVMPSNYNNSTLTARFYWTASSGSGGVAWGISGRAFGDDDPIDAATGTRIVVTDTLLASNDVHVTAATSAVTIDGTPAANKAINFQISRVVADAADTLAVDARLLGVEILFN